MGRSTCRITFVSEIDQLEDLAMSLAVVTPPAERECKPYIPFFGILVPLEGREPREAWGVSREPSHVHFLTVSQAKLTVEVGISNTPPEAWAAQVCAARPGMKIEMTHLADDGGGFWLTVTEVGPLGTPGPVDADSDLYSYEGVPVVKRSYDEVFAWMYEEMKVDWQPYYELTLRLGERILSKKYRPRLLEWIRANSLDEVVGYEEVVYALRAVIADVLLEVEEWPVVASLLTPESLVQQREDAGIYEENGKLFIDDMWVYPSA